MPAGDVEQPDVHSLIVSGGAQQSGRIAQRLLDPTHRVPNRMGWVALARAGLDDLAANMRADDRIRMTVDAADEKLVPTLDTRQVARDTCGAIPCKRHEVIFPLTTTHRRRQPQLGPHMHRVHLLNRASNRSADA
jgi:hypothetical protein